MYGIIWCQVSFNCQSFVASLPLSASLQSGISAETRAVAFRQPSMPSRPPGKTWFSGVVISRRSSAPPPPTLTKSLLDTSLQFTSALVDWRIRRRIWSLSVLVLLLLPFPVVHQSTPQGSTTATTPVSGLPAELQMSMYSGLPISEVFI